MTEQEVLKQYQIPNVILKEYHEWGLCDGGEADSRRYTDADIQRLSELMALHEMGFQKEEVKRFLELVQKGDSTKPERMKLLNSQRAKVLAEIHDKERQIQRMDYLRNQMRK